MKGIKIISIDNDGSESLMAYYELENGRAFLRQGKAIQGLDNKNMTDGLKFLQDLTRFYTPFGTRIRSVIVK